MCETMSLNFLQNIIDVYVVSGNNRSFSDPITIRTYVQPEKFVDELAHEFTHRLMADNVQCLNKTRMGVILKNVFPKEPGDVRSHIQTYATLKRIFVDTLGDSNWTERNLKIMAGSPRPEYKKAWKIVEEIGHTEVIKMIREEREKNLN